MQGHAAANMIPLVASNRVGRETEPKPITFYGTSFIAGYTGEILAEANRQDAAPNLATVDLDAAAAYREGWGVFRDRRVDLYGGLLSLDGRPRRP